MVLVLFYSNKAYVWFNCQKQLDQQPWNNANNKTDVCNDKKF